MPFEARAAIGIAVERQGESGPGATRQLKRQRMSGQVESLRLAALRSPVHAEVIAGRALDEPAVPDRGQLQRVGVEQQRAVGKAERGGPGDSQHFAPLHDGPQQRGLDHHRRVVHRRGRRRSTAEPGPERIDRGAGGSVSSAGSVPCRRAGSFAASWCRGECGPGSSASGRNTPAASGPQVCPAPARGWLGQPGPRASCRAANGNSRRPGLSCRSASAQSQAGPAWIGQRESRELPARGADSAQSRRREP